VKQVLEQVTREAMFEAVLEKGLAIMKKDGEKGRKTLALARRKLDALRKAFPDRASVFNYHLARMHLALGENEAALQVIEVSLQEQGENARFRRVRMQAAENLSRVDLVQKDRKFLEDLIERSQDMDLLQPLEAGAGKEGEKK